LPDWTEGFTPSEAETLFPLAREVGVELQGSVVSPDGFEPGADEGERRRCDWGADVARHV
jgi:hypothetical protein